MFAVLVFEWHMYDMLIGWSNNAEDFSQVSYEHPAMTPRTNH
jgi:hypothetical protein